RYVKKKLLIYLIYIFTFLFDFLIVESRQSNTICLTFINEKKTDRTESKMILLKKKQKHLKIVLHLRMVNKKSSAMTRGIEYEQKRRGSGRLQRSV
ncbi:MAG: hypothetical protein L0J46_06940, partial [Enterococcus sp.]|uniref:hypothetical protein n=1 Tax=Enterococcus sp. TaxID=35783 RepID=UPI0026489357